MYFKKLQKKEGGQVSFISPLSCIKPLSLNFHQPSRILLWSKDSCNLEFKINTYACVCVHTHTHRHMTTVLEVRNTWQQCLRSGSLGSHPDSTAYHWYNCGQCLLFWNWVSVRLYPVVLSSFSILWALWSCIGIFSAYIDFETPHSWLLVRLALFSFLNQKNPPRLLLKKK